MERWSRWCRTCLTGWLELFPYFNFLGVKDSEYHSTFKETYFPTGVSHNLYTPVVVGVARNTARSDV